MFLMITMSLTSYWPIKGRGLSGQLRVSSKYTLAPSPERVESQEEFRVSTWTEPTSGPSAAPFYLPEPVSKFVKWG